MSIPVQPIWRSARIIDNSICADLGSGASYSSLAAGSGISTDIVSFALNSSAFTDINGALGGGGIFRSVRPALVELLSTARDRPDAPALHSNPCSSRVQRLSSRNQNLLLSSASASRVLAAYVAEKLPESHGRKFYRMRRFFGAAVFIYRMSAWGQKQKVKGTVSESAFAACFR